VNGLSSGRAKSGSPGRGADQVDLFFFLDVKAGARLELKRRGKVLCNKSNGGKERAGRGKKTGIEKETVSNS